MFFDEFLEGLLEHEDFDDFASFRSQELCAGGDQVGNGV
jgi:hypothetical protein